MKKYLYHVTSVDNFPKILNDGLKSSDGMIFVFSERKAAPSIAINQCFLKSYALLRIDPVGITESLIVDKVAESTAIYQFYTTQKMISSKYISLINCYNVI